MRPGKALRNASFILAAAALFLSAAACSSTPAAPALSDPKDILTKATTTVSNATAVHAKVTLTGNLKLDLSSLTGGSGSGASGSSIDLKGTEAEVWSDVKTKSARITFSAPALLSTSGEIIQVGNDSYFKLAGPFAAMLGGDGTKYVKSTSPADTSAIADPSAAAGNVTDLLGKPGVDAKLVGTESVNGRQSYHVKMNVPQEELGAAASAGAQLTSATVDLWVAVDNNQLTRFQVQASGTDTGTITVTADIDYPSSVDVKAPPADQVQESTASPLTLIP